MAKIQILICAFFAVIVAASALNAPQIQKTSQIDEVLIVESIEDFIKANPKATVIPMKKEVPTLKARTNNRLPIRYTMGNRNGYDRILTTGQNSLYYPTLQDVKLQLSYPQSGIGAIVTFVEIVVEQSSSLGQAYIVAGRIGERYIRVVIEARQTSYFIYRAQFFGY